MLKKEQRSRAVTSKVDTGDLLSRRFISMREGVAFRWAAYTKDIHVNYDHGHIVRLCRCINIEPGHMRLQAGIDLINDPQ